VLEKLRGPLVVRQAHHERQFIPLTLSLSKGERRVLQHPAYVAHVWQWRQKLVIRCPAVISVMDAPQLGQGWPCPTVSYRPAPLEMPASRPPSDLLIA
jgi:hypothetical protein